MTRAPPARLPSGRAAAPLTRAALLGALLVLATDLPAGSLAASGTTRRKPPPLGPRILRAVRAGATEELLALLDERRPEDDLDYRDPSDGQTALMASCLYGHADMLGALLDAGADPLAGERDGYTCAHGAAFQGRPAAMRAAIEGGLDWQSFHPDGYAPLHRALWKGTRGHVETLAIMIEAGVDVNLADRDSSKGWTPVHLALRTRNWEALRLLVEAGAQAADWEREEHAEGWEAFVEWRRTSAARAPAGEARRGEL
eukprot:PRCOL_00006992-RA